MVAALVVVSTTLTPGVYTPTTPEPLKLARVFSIGATSFMSKVKTGSENRLVYFVIVASIRSEYIECAPS